MILYGRQQPLSNREMTGCHIFNMSCQLPNMPVHLKNIEIAAAGKLPQSSNLRGSAKLERGHFEL